ncbi:MAG: MFS transporter [Anaerolineales bacterium]
MTFQERFFQRFPALASRDFAIFWVGQFISLIGSWMQNTTQPYLAFRLTGRPFDLGLIGVAATLPTLILALPAGVLVEHLDKRKAVIALQTVMMIQALSMAFLSLSGKIQFWHILALSLLLGAANAIEITARQAMLIELVGKERLPNAIALQSTIFNAACVIGPSLAAPFLIFIKSNGEGWAFLSNGVSYLFVIIGLMFVRTPFRQQGQPKSSNFFQDLREGFRYILATPAVSVLILMATLMGLFGFPFSQQIPAVARDVLAQIGDSAQSVAFRNSALYTAQGVGALISAIALAAYTPRRKGISLTIGQIFFIFGLIAISQTKSLPLALVWMVILGWGMVTQLAMMNILIQLEVPNELRGRVFSTYLWGLQGVAPFGSLVVGWMAQNWGVSVAALICGLLCLAALTAMHLNAPAIRRA